MKPLERTQKRLVRLLKRLPPRAHTKPVMTELKLLTVYKLYTLRVCIEMHPHVHKTAKTTQHQPQHDHNYISVSNIHDHNTRLARSGHQFAHRNHHFTKHLNSQYLDTWNALPQKLREITALAGFKTELKTYLLEQQARD